MNANLIERVIIASILQDLGSDLPPTILRVLDFAPEGWTGPETGLIAAAVKNSRSNGQPTTIITVAEYLGPELTPALMAFLNETSLILPLGVAELEAEKLLAAIQGHRTIAVLGEALSTAKDHPEDAIAIIARTSHALEQIASEFPRIGGLPEILDASEFVVLPVEKPTELIRRILHKGSKMVLGGGSKSFKTWMLLDLALSVSHGKPWLSYDTSPGRVLYVNFEVQSWSWQERLTAVAKARGIAIEPGRLSLWNLRGKAATFELLLPQIRDKVKKDFALIILDPIYKLYGHADENKASDVARLLNAIEDLTVETGAAVAFGAHFSKGNQSAKESIDRISGSGVFARDPDSLLVFTQHQTHDAFTVEATLRNFAPVEPFVARWQFPIMQRDGHLDPGKLKKAQGRKKLHSAEDLLED